MEIRPDIPVILCTGYSPGISKESVLLLGIKDLALKPLAMDEISKLIRRTLDAVKAPSERIFPEWRQNL
jgi:DNA-binding NtrC family response regulator